MSDEEHIRDLELKLAFQERTVDALSRSVYELQTRLDRVEHAYRELREQVKAVSEKLPDDLPEDEKPPHY